MPSVDELRVETPNGAHRVRVAGTGTPMMVIPGGPGWGARYMVESLLELIGDARKLIFVDQRGTGESPVGAGPLTVEAYVEDMNAIADHMKLDRFELFGHSFGGLQAMKYAIAHQGRVNRMVIADGDPPLRSLWNAASAPGSRFDQRTRPEDQAEISELTGDESWMSAQETLDRFLILAYRPLYADPEVAERIDHGMNWTRYSQLQATTRAVRSALGEWDFTEDLRGVSVPTLLVYCRESIFEREVPELLSDRLPNAMLVWVEGGHAPFIEDPDGFRLAVQAFIGPT